MPLGVLVICILTVVSSGYILLRPERDTEGRLMWTFVQTRAPMYRDIVEEWGLAGEEKMRIDLVEHGALGRRILAGFMAGTPLADILEVERSLAAPTWRGPIEAVGFVDLKERLREEGLLEKINRPSFSPWTNRGHIFGLPADVHPVLLCYRADVFEAAGIDVSELDTWEKYFEATRGLVQDFNGDGQPDQYVLELQETTGEPITVLLLQGGGQLFNEREEAVLNMDRNIELLARMADWANGEDRVTGDLDLFSGAGHRLRGEGYVLSWMVPDWRAYHMSLYLGGLEGKLKLMPLPAWEEGGRRTSCWGGTMLGFPKEKDNFEKNWEFAKRLYLSRELAVRSWKETGVLTPVKAFWDDPVFSEPNPFYSGQPTGRLFIEQAEDVPVRSSSPYRNLAVQELANAFNSLLGEARRKGLEDPSALEAAARQVLDQAQKNILRQMERNQFIEATGTLPES